MTRQDEIAAKAVRASTLKSLKLKKKLRIKQIEKDAENKIREINIQYAEDPERLRAKYAADDYARSERAKKRAQRRIEIEKRHIAYEKKLRRYSIGEEIFSAIVQGLGCCLFIVATVLLDVLAIGNIPSSETDKIPVYLAMYTTFGATMFFNYLMSTLQHSLTNATAKEVFRRLNRSGVFLSIACIYISYALLSTGGQFARSNAFEWAVTFAVLAVCLTGIFMYAIAGSRLDVVNIVLYAVSGCAVFLIIRRLYYGVSPASFGLMITTGILCAIGLIFCSIRKVKFMHAFGDVILLIGSITLFLSFFMIYQ